VKSTHSRRAPAVSAVALVLVMLGMTSGAVAGAAKPASHTVTIEGTAFSPADLSVVAGDTIVWVNKDPYPHSATSTAGSGFDSRSIAPEKSWKYVARKKGDFPYICSIHPSMKATLHVK
jgi:plastocyanin